MNQTRKINIGLIGAGWIGGVHSECYKRIEPMFGLQPGTIKLYTVADILEDNAAKFTRRYGYDRYTSDWKKLVNDPEVNLVDICVDNRLHHEIVMQAASRGKNIICEKPLAINLRQAKEMMEVVEEKKLGNMINYNYRKVPAIVYLKNMLDSGELGKVYNYRSLIAQDFAADEQMPYNWRFNMAASGGGSLVTMGNHVFDMARYLIGDIERLTADCETFIKRRPIEVGKNKFREVDVDDLAIGIVNFQNGCKGVLESCWLIHGRKHYFEIEVYGSKGSVIFVSERLNELRICESSQPRLASGFKEVLIGQDHPYGEIFNLKTGMGIGIKETFIIQLHDFVRSIIDNSRCSPDFRDGYEAQKISQAFQDSCMKNEWIRL
jgi:predicted dehydrogenase